MVFVMIASWVRCFRRQAKLGPSRIQNRPRDPTLSLLAAVSPSLSGETYTRYLLRADGGGAATTKDEKKGTKKTKKKGVPHTRAISQRSRAAVVVVALSHVCCRAHTVFSLSLSVENKKRGLLHARIITAVQRDASLRSPSPGMYTHTAHGGPNRTRATEFSDSGESAPRRGAIRQAQAAHTAAAAAAAARPPQSCQRCRLLGSRSRRRRRRAFRGKRAAARADV